MNVRHFLLFTAMLVIAVSAAWADDKDKVNSNSSKSDAAKKDMAELQGEWTMVSGSADGQEMPEAMLKQARRICKGDVTSVTIGGQTFLKAKFTIDPSKKPKAIDYEMLDGITKGKKQLGIYELGGNTVKFCFASPDVERPGDFKAGDKRSSSVWKRIKASPERKEK
jgi:uncharacterized protein (TIGR03067 family)